MGLISTVLKAVGPKAASIASKAAPVVSSTSKAAVEGIKNFGKSIGTKLDDAFMKAGAKTTSQVTTELGPVIASEYGETAAKNVFSNMSDFFKKTFDGDAGAWMKGTFNANRDKFGHGFKGTVASGVLTGTEATGKVMTGLAGKAGSSIISNVMGSEALEKFSQSSVGQMVDKVLQNKFVSHAVGGITGVSAVSALSGNAMQPIVNAASTGINGMKSTVDVVGDLTTGVTGIANEFAQGDLAGMAGEVMNFVGEHPLATGAVALLAGGGLDSIVGKAGAALIGFSFAKNFIENTANDAKENAAAREFAQKGEISRPDLTKGVVDYDDAYDDTPIPIEPSESMVDFKLSEDALKAASTANKPVPPMLTGPVNTGLTSTDSYGYDGGM